MSYLFAQYYYVSSCSDFLFYLELSCGLRTYSFVLMGPQRGFGVHHSTSFKINLESHVVLSRSLAHCGEHGEGEDVCGFCPAKVFACKCVDSEE